LAQDDSILLLTNAAGATARGAQVESMLERFIAELAAEVGELTPLPEKATADDVDAAFASLLSRAATGRRVVVLLDALNQFNPTTRAIHLTWLRARQWPANARLIATSLVGPAAEALSQWAGIVELDVPPLTIAESKRADGEQTDNEQTDDVAAIAQAVYQRYHRHVNQPVVCLLREKRQPDGAHAAANPLWLTLALEQINLLDADDFARADRDFADRGGPAERQRAMLIDTAERMPPTVDELYDTLLAQSEKIFGRAASRAFAALIAVSRFGWRESDLLSLIPVAARLLCPDQPPVEITPLDLANLRRSFRAHLVRRGTFEQLDFFHQQMRQAVEQRSLRDVAPTQSLHRAIADHLESLPHDDSLRINELMVHLIGGDDSGRAARHLADLTVPLGMPSASTRVLADHMLTGDGDQRRIHTHWVTDLLDQQELTDSQIAALANRFVFDLGYPLATTSDLGTRRSLFDAARRAQRMAEADPANVVWQYDLSASFSRLGDLATARGQLPEAQQLFGEALRIARWLTNGNPAITEWKRDLSESCIKLADVATAQGNLAEAQRLLSEALRIRQRLVESDPANAAWQRDLARSHCGVGMIQQHHGNLTAAKDSFEQYRDIFRQLAESDPANALWQRELCVSFGKLGEIAKAQGNLLNAQRLWGDAHRITQRLAERDRTNAAWQRDLSVSFGNLGDLARALGQLPEAQRLSGEAHFITQRLSESDLGNAAWQRDLYVSFIKLGDIATAQGNLAEAQRLWGDAHRIAQRLAESDPTNTEWQRDLSASFSRLGDLATAQGNLPEAQRLFGESLRIQQRLTESEPTITEWQRDLSVSLSQLGNLAEAQGNLSEAQRLTGESFHIRQALAESDPANAEWQFDLGVSAERLGDIASAQGRLDAAKPFYMIKRDIIQRLAKSDPDNAAWQRDLAVSHYKLAVFARQSGDELCFRKELLECYLVMKMMRERQLPFDPQLAQVYRQLVGVFGGSS
ncbi:MAG: tetratricopeptide repeat protein, partial [Planctomycetales bacterium]|nr:tetratricopeptide repeat protein [Planctomycetales bacterium]